MGFPSKIREDIFVKSARHCCVCHRYKGIKVEIHHILPKKQGGEDTFENAISLCFDCHSDAGHYFAGHPKGSKFSPEELLKHKNEWFRIVQEHQIESSNLPNVELIIKDGHFEPVFIKEVTKFVDKNIFRSSAKLLGKDPLDFLEKLKEDNNPEKNNFYLPFLNSVKTYDQYIDFLNGDYPKKDFLKHKDENENTNCQPIVYKMSSFISSSSIERNLSNCTLSLKFTNNGNEVLEDYKLYLYFDGVVEIDTINKNNSFSDISEYKYNVLFIEKNKAEFIPKSNILVQKDSIELDKICFRTYHKTKSVSLKWELFGRGIHDSGDLVLNIKPKFIKEEIEKHVENPDKFDSKIRILPKIKFE